MTFDTPQERHDYIMANRGLVYAIVNKLRLMRIEREDAIQRGYVGLIRAVDGFDSSKGDFAAYAAKAITKNITNLANSSTRIGTAPRQVATLYAKQLRGEVLSPRQQEMVDAYVAARRATANAVEFDVPAVRQEHWESIKRQYDEAIAAIDGLDPLARHVLRRRFSLDPGGTAWDKIAHELKKYPDLLEIRMRSEIAKVRDRIRRVA